MLQHLDFLNKSKNSRGYVALMSVLIISAIGVIIVTSLLSLGTSYQRSIFVIQQQFNTQSLSHACSNVALMKIKLDALYEGGESINFGADNCDILPITQTNGLYTIKIQSVSNYISQKTQIVVSRIENPDTFAVTLTIESWKNMADF